MNTRVGFAGLGAMGLPMVLSLRRAGIDVVTWNRSHRPRTEATQAGADWAPDIPALGRSAATVITMLPDLLQVRAVLAAGLLGPGSTLTTLVVMGTVSPVGIRDLAAELSGIALVDAPVSGGTRGARDATLSIMVGGDAVDIEPLRPVFDAMGRVVRHMGPLGAGQLTKACNQLVVAGTLTALAEAVMLGERGGLDTHALLDVLAGGLASSQVLAQKRKHFASGNFEGDGAAKYLLKDLGFVTEAAAASATALPVTSVITTLYRQLTAAGLGELDNSVILEWLREAPVDQAWIH